MWIWAAAAAWAGWSPSWEGEYLVHSEVLLPRAVRFALDDGSGFETRSWQVRARIRCGRVDGPRHPLRCEVVDARLTASAFPDSRNPDPAGVAQVLAGHADALRKLSLVLDVTDRGRVRRWESEGREQGSATATERGWVTELTLERAVAGLLVELPPEVPAPGGQWLETRAQLFAFPRWEGHFSVGTAQVLHQVASVGERVVVDCSADGTLVDEGWQLKETGRCRATLSASGQLIERSWNVDGTELDTVRYHHAGWARRLEPGEVPDLGEHRQVRAPGEGPEADRPGLPPWPDL